MHHLVALLMLSTISSVISPLFAQNKVPNSTTYDELRNNFKKVQSDSSAARIYANTYLFIAKQNKDTLSIADAYYLLSLVHDNELTVKYLDSIITSTKNIKDHETYPARAYLEKGNVYFNNGLFKKALNEYLKGSESSEGTNKTLYMTIRFNIGLLRNFLGDYEEAQPIFKEYLEYIDESQDQEKYKDYNKALYAIGDSYLNSKKLDSADLIIAKGIKKTIADKDSIVYPYFVMSSGMSSFYRKKYPLAIDSMIRAKTLLSLTNDIGNLAICDLYLGQSLKEVGKMDEALGYFKEVDSLIFDKKLITPKLLESYYFLIDYYKSNGDTKNQLFYLNNLIELDSLLNANHNYIAKSIIKKYDTPQLLSAKEDLINELQRDKFLSQKTIVFLSLATFLFLAIALYFIRRNTINKKRFKKLMVIYESKNNSSSSAKKTSKIIDYDKTNMRLSKEVVDEILRKLNHFEKTNRFIKKNSSLNKVAKDLNTNSTYLSKIINVTKKTNFANYLNELRIDYVIKRLKEDKQLRSYTIKAIAQEVGYNNAQSFSVAFRKKTGIYPSFFIEELEKLEKLDKLENEIAQK